MDEVENENGNIECNPTELTNKIRSPDDYRQFLILNE